MNILVLKHGALGNVVLALGAFAAIRQRHPDARITLLTTAPYAGWMAESPWFDRVLIDARPAWWNPTGVLRLRRVLRDGRFGRVYDLQTSGRSSRYFRLFPRGARPEWSGIAPGCSHPDRNPGRDHMHDIERLHSQLRQAGIAELAPADLSWCHGDIARFVLPRRFALLVPGSSAHRTVKRWPAAYYRILATWLAAQGITPVVLGTAGERMLAEEICAGATTLEAGVTTRETDTTTQTADTADQRAGTTAQWAGSTTQKSDTAAQRAGTTGRAAEMTMAVAGMTMQQAGARNVTGQTSFGDLADLGRAATMAIGNDTGPMHLLATVGCPSLVLFSRDSDPAKCVPHAPLGAPPVRVLRRDDLATLTPDEVIAELTTHAPTIGAPTTGAPTIGAPTIGAAARATEERTAARAVLPVPAKMSS